MRVLRPTVPLWFVAALSLLGEPTALSRSDESKAGMDAERLARIPLRMQSFVDKGAIPGVVTLVARHGVVASLEAVGYQDLESKKPMKTDSIFQIMSMTKPVTALGIMILMEEGRLALSDRVEKHLPEFRGMWMIESRIGDKQRVLKKPSRPITIRDLMTHTSGMPGTPPEGISDLNFELNRTLAEGAAIYSQQPLEFEPGTRWLYSDTGFASLGRIIEIVSGQSYERFLEERIFKPLGMKDSFIFPATENQDRIAMVYKLENLKLKRAGSNIYGGDPWKFRKGAIYPLPEAGIHSTAPDLFLLYQMMLNGGTHNSKQILSRASVE